ncbi:MAG: alcohol dehydrogenase catalytic domain-containing protein [Candidatus Gastranaerophilales bacterium]|nr:alcohol dehydrogenase catalytic domain-containing protein [Candidatus Gastranaerophilales bacterium]
MKSAILKEGKVIISNVPVPDLKNKYGAIIKVHGCGLCGSDIVKIDTCSKNKTVKLGHEIVGEIIDINVQSKFKKGDIVAMGHHYPCFKCKYCSRGNYSMCDTFKNSNIEPAGFSEYIYADENHLKYTVFKKPAGLSEEEFSFLEPLACCIRAIRRSGADETFNSLVIGLGSIGILMYQSLKAFNIPAFGYDINPLRQNYAPFNPDIKYDAIFMTSGSFGAIGTALEFADKGAVIIVFSSVKNEAGYKNNEIYYNELEILGSYSPSPYDLKLSSELLAEKKVKTLGLYSEYPLFELEKAIHDTKNGKILKGYIKI